MAALHEIDGHTFYLPALGPGSVVLDLGASRAGFAVEVNRLTGCTCHCAEASPGVFGLMAAAPGIHHHHVAITGADGPLAMRIGGHQDGGYWMKADDGADVGDGADAGDIAEIPGLTLESFFVRCGVETADLIKLDIEGAEFAMFDAASDTTLKRALQWSIEFHDFLDPALTPSVKAVIARLEGLGFDAVVMTRRGHGDVLFLDRARLNVSIRQLLYMRWGVKYGRGIRRMLARRFAQAA